MALIWKKFEPRPDPFESTVGNGFCYEVHYATSTCEFGMDLEVDLKELVSKALSFASVTTWRGRAKRMLILWDSVYCTLTLVSTDETLMLDSPQVVKCQFEGLERYLEKVSKGGYGEWEKKVTELTLQIRTRLTEVVQELDLTTLPVGMPILFSSEDRSGIGAANFAAQILYGAE